MPARERAAVGQRGWIMGDRREVFNRPGGWLAALVFVGCGTPGFPAHAQGRRREVVVNGKRVRTVDVHAHCAVPEALALMNLKLAGPSLRPDLDMTEALAERLATMDEQGVDV